MYLQKGSVRVKSLKGSRSDTSLMGVDKREIKEYRISEELFPIFVKLEGDKLYPTNYVPSDKIITKNIGIAPIDSSDIGSIFHDEKISREIKTRRGQAKFRNGLLALYEHECCITKSRIIQVLEAAHIVPHGDETDYGIENGLLLRADVHTLFDLGMISIDSSFIVHLSNFLKDSEYEVFEGKQLNLIDSTLLKERLAERHDSFILSQSN